MVFANNLLAGAAAAAGPGGYVILQSAYPDGTSAYMTRAGVSGSSTKGTVWRWAKGYGSQSQQCIFFTRNFPTGYSQFQHSTYNGLGTWSYQHTSSFTTVEMNTTARPVDPTAWRLEMLAWDTTQGTAANRMRLYYNFDEVSWTHNNSGGAPIYPSSSLAIPFADSSYSNYLGTFYWGSPSNYLQDSAAMWGYCDGTQLTPSDVAEQDARGNTIPLDLITPGTFDVGSAGFLMDFADTGNYGKDVAPIVGSHTTARDCTVTGTWTQTNDSPTDSKTDGVGNYATLNPLDQYNASGSMTFSDGNTAFTPSDTGIHIPWLTQALSTNDTTKYYFEIETPSGNDLGAYISNQALDHASATRNIADTWYCGLENTTTFRANEENSGNIDATLSATYDYSADRIGVALDPANGKAWVGHVDDSAAATEWKGPSTSMNGDPAAGTNATLTPDTQNGSMWQLGVFNSNGSGRKSIIHMDADSWVGTPPTGFDNAIYTASLPAPTVTDPSTAFNTVLYEGNGTAIGSGGNAISSVGFQPDFVWIKNRDAADSNMLFDVARGATKYMETDDGSNGETTDTESLSTFDSDGFTVGNNAAVNTNAESYVAWCWKLGGSASSNTDGGLTTNVTVADHGGMSIGTYTGDGTDTSFGHGLTAGSPEFVVVKKRSGGSAYGWTTWHKDLAQAYSAVFLNSSAAADNGDTNYWSAQAPDATKVYVKDVSGQLNTSGHAYSFITATRVPGLIGIGSFEGNASDDGSYVVVDDNGSGFAPAFVLIKNIDSGGSWCLFDNQRPGYNASTKGLLFPNASSAENNTNNIDFIANGFKCRGTSAAYNQDTLIYLAFAEYPFGGEGISQARAR